MTSADAYPVGLDPVHILAICTRATGSTAGIHVVPAQDGVRVGFPARGAAWEASSALGRAGYTAALTGGGRARWDVLVTGWNAARLDSRLAAMRSVMHRLADNPLVTATAAVRRFATLPAAAATSQAGTEILCETRQQLQGWADGRVGICVPAPAAVPADAGTAMRVRAVASCEQVISDLIDRHLRVAGHALTLFDSLRQQMSDIRAQDVAIHRAGITFHVSGEPIAQDSSPLMRSASADPAAARRTRPGDRPRRGMAGEFPARPGAAPPPGTDPLSGRPGPGGQGFPAAPPGPPPLSTWLHPMATVAWRTDGYRQ